MYRTLANLTAIAASGAIALVAGCSGGSQGATPSIPSTLQPDIFSQESVPKDLYISNSVSQTVDTIEVYGNRHYKHHRTITKGLSGAEGLWVDSAGNLYAANSQLATVSEYAPGGTSPKCTYSKNIVSPIDEATDSKGNVYIVDFNHFQSPGYIDEFKQCSNALIARYSIITPPEGVAVDAKGDIFVSYVTVAGGAFEEFKQGSKNPTELKAMIGSPGGLAIDGKGNLIADDQRGEIDVIAPPYKKATTLVSGLYNPYRLSLNKDQTLLFNVDTGTGVVSIYKYPSGKLVRSLGSRDGLANPVGVSDSPNAAF